MLESDLHHRGIPHSLHGVGRGFTVEEDLGDGSGDWRGASNPYYGVWGFASTIMALFATENVRNMIFKSVF